ncbi:MAG: ABC transporter permease [Parasporobacterium sp.]|nr:ABC transporter permease [Parasporobacterium sp.]
MSSGNKTQSYLSDGGKKHSQWGDIWFRLRHNVPAMICLGVIILLIIVVVFADVIAPYDYAKMSPKEKFMYPCAEHWLGTDNYGRDILSRIIYGGRISLLVSVLAVVISLIIGGFLGVLAGYFGGMYDNIAMRVMDILMGIPSFLLAVCVSAALGTGILNTAIAIAVSGIPSYARLLRAQVMAIKGGEYIEVARSLGNSDMRIILKHIIPNVLSPIIVQSTLNIGAFIMAISGLSFVGLGVQPPIPEWGSIMSAGRDFFRDFYPIVTFPGIAILITLVSFNLLGDGLRDAMDPKLRQ